MNINEILSVMPHRYPFLLIDKILELVPGERAVGLKNVSANEPYFVGHFPDRPIMPGVLIVEMMAQVGGVTMLTKESNYGKMAYLAGVDKCRFRKPVLPGDQIIAEVSLMWERGTLMRLKCSAKVDGKQVCDAELMFAIMDNQFTPSDNPPTAAIQAAAERKG